MAAALSATTPPAAAQSTATPVYRCGSSYGSSPCPGGTAIEADDPRSAAQKQQAEAVRQRDAAMADQLAAERHARERAAAGQQAVGIGPSAASPPATKASAGKTRPKKYKKMPVTQPAGAASQPGTH